MLKGSHESQVIAKNCQVVSIISSPWPYQCSGQVLKPSTFFSFKVGN